MAKILGFLLGILGAAAIVTVVFLTACTPFTKTVVVTATPDLNATVQAAISATTNAGRQQAGIAPQAPQIAAPAVQVAPAPQVQIQTGSTNPPAQPAVQIQSVSCPQGDFTGQSGTKTFSFTLPQGCVAIIEGFMVDGQNLVFKAVRGTGGQISATIQDGAVTISPEASARDTFCGRLQTEKNIPFKAIVPLPGWQSC